MYMYVIVLGSHGITKVFPFYQSFYGLCHDFPVSSVEVPEDDRFNIKLVVFSILLTSIDFILLKHFPVLKYYYKSLFNYI